MPAPRSDEPATRLESSQELLARARGGDREALDRLCARYLPRLRRWARGRLPGWARDRFDTDDLVQETLSRAVGRLEGFEDRGDGALQAYLRQALLNQVRDEVRRAGRRGPARDAAQEGVEPGPSPLEAAIGGERLRRYEAALLGLREEDRAAIVTRVELGCSYAEVAEALGKPSADAARMAVSRAVARLAARLGHA
jgi:RNA polymerase sigma-70 factor (ECF subfamily)